MKKEISRKLGWKSYWINKRAKKTLGTPLDLKNIIELAHVSNHLVYDQADCLTLAYAKKRFKDQTIPDEEQIEPIIPGSIIKLALQAQHMTQKDCADILKMNPVMFNQIISGKRPITLDTALVLEEVLQVPAHIFMRLEADYELYQRRKALMTEARTEQEKETQRKLAKTKQMLEWAISHIFTYPSYNNVNHAYQEWLHIYYS